MIRCKKFLKPQFILLLTFLGQMLIYLLYATGIIKSFRISFVSTSSLGYFILFLFYGIQIFIVYFGTRTKKRRKVIVECIKPRRVLILIYLYMIVSLIGLFRLTASFAGKYNITQLVYMLLRNQQIGMLSYGQGNTILCTFAIVSLIMLAIIFKKNKIYIITFAINFLLLVVYASFLSSRILIIEGCFFATVILFRRYLYELKIRVKYLVIALVMVLALLIVTSGYRDYDTMGYKYTDSKMEWGISRIADYFISTMNTSLEVADHAEYKKSSFPSGTFELLSKFGIMESNSESNAGYEWRAVVSAREYTNIGALAQIYLDYRMMILVYIVVLAMFYVYSWKHFDKGTLLGYCVYPIVLYNILETWRIFFLGTAMAEVLLIVAAVNCFICKSSFVVIRKVN